MNQYFKSNPSKYLLIFKGYKNLVVENVGDSGLKIYENFRTFRWSNNLVMR